MRRKSKPVDPKKSQSSLREFWQVILVAFIAAVSPILVAVINKPAPQSFENRVSIAKLNQAEIEKGFENQKDAAQKIKSETDDEQTRQNLDKFIAEIEKNQAEHKEASDKFINKLNAKDETSAEIERRKANKLIEESNQLAMNTQTKLNDPQEISLNEKKNVDEGSRMRELLKPCIDNVKNNPEKFPGEYQSLLLGKLIVTERIGCDPRIVPLGVRIPIPTIDNYNQFKTIKQVNPKDIKDKLAIMDVQDRVKRKRDSVE